jgi:hypothetical protein
VGLAPPPPLAHSYNYFGGERIDIFGRIPFLSDFPKADAILQKYTVTVQAIVRSAWKQCLLNDTHKTATQRSDTCRLDVVEQLPAVTTLKNDLFAVARRVLGAWPTRTLAALPDTPERIPQLQTLGGTQMRDHARSRHNVSYLRAHGSCMDYVHVQPSTTMPVAGRGAFATRFLPHGSVVAPVPLIHLPDASVLDMYPGAGSASRATGRNMADAPIHQQLLLNYCYGHKESTLLLCPYGVVSSLVNHAPRSSASTTTNNMTTANVKIEWSSKISSHLEWREQPISKWGHLYQAGLGFDYVALRDIHEGEEILVDYGADWQRSWDAHVANWRPVERMVDVLNRNVNSVIPTEQEWTWSMGDPTENKQAVNLWCYNSYREMQGLKMASDDAYPCKVVLRLGNDAHAVYTAELVYREQLVDSDDEMCKEFFDEVLWMLPRDAFAYGGVHERFDTREYMIPGTFRHPLGIPDDIMPDAWKNLRFNLTTVSVERKARPANATTGTTGA